MGHQNAVRRWIDHGLIHEFPSAVCFKSVCAAFHSDQLNYIVSDPNLFRRVAQQFQPRVSELPGQFPVILVLNTFTLMIAENAVTRCDLG